MKTLRCLAILILGLCLGHGSVTAEPAGQAANEAVDSLEELREKAEAGNPEARYILGAVYYQGKGVPQDYTEAANWLRKSAEQGVADAQLLLGLLYQEGEGVPQDSVIACKWLNLAVAAGLKEARQDRGSAAAELTRVELDEARRISREWKPKTPENQ